MLPKTLHQRNHETVRTMRNGLPAKQQTIDESVYRLGVALHELLNPAKVIGVGEC